MPVSSDAVLAECQRLESILQEINGRVLDPCPEILADRQQELAVIASSLQTLHESIAASIAGSRAAETGAPDCLQSNPTIRQTLHHIRSMARDLGAKFLYGSNYCAGLLQIRFGTGYSDQGQPVLWPTQPRNSFEG